MLAYCNLYQCIIPVLVPHFNVGNGNLKLFYCSLGCSPEIHVTGVPANRNPGVWCERMGGMTQMPLVAAIALIVTAVLFVVGIITLIVGFATHRVSMESPLADDDDNDDLSDDTATLAVHAARCVRGGRRARRGGPLQSRRYRLGVVSDDAIAQQHVLDAIHEARKSGGKRQFDLTTDTPERYVADQNKGDHVATQSVHRPNWLKVTVGRINEQFVIVLITDVSDVIRFAQVRDSFITNVSEQLLGPTEALAKLADSLESGNLDEQQVAADASPGAFQLQQAQPHGV